MFFSNKQFSNRCMLREYRTLTDTQGKSTILEIYFADLDYRNVYRNVAQIS